MNRWQKLVVVLCAMLAFLIGANPLAGAALVIGATTTTVDLDAALKIFFSEPLVKNIVTDTELLSLFDQDSDVQVERTTGGRYIETAQMFQLPAGVRAGKEGDYIPVPSGPVIKNSKIYLRKILGTIEMTGDTMDRVQGDAGAYINYLEQSLPSLLERVNNYVDRVMLGYGAGALARISSTSGTTPCIITLKDSHGLAGYSDAWLNFLEGDTLVASDTIGATTLRNSGAPSATVTFVDQANNKITVNTNPGSAWVANDYLFHGDNAGNAAADAAGDDREPMGLFGHVDDGSILATYQNIARASYQQWNAVTVNGGLAPYNGVLGEDVITRADRDTRVMGMGKINALIASETGAESFWKSLKGDRVLNDARNFDGGKGRLRMFLGDRVVEIRAARKMPREVCLGLTTSTFKRHMLNDWEWASRQGSIWNLVTDANGRKDAYFAFGYMRKQTSCKAPRKNFKIYGLSGS